MQIPISQKKDESVISTAKNVLLLAGMSVLILLGTRLASFNLVAFILGCYCIIRNEYISILMLFYLLPFATILKLAAGTTSLFTFWELLFVIVHFVRSRFTATKVEVAAIIFTMYIVIIEVFNGKIDILVTVKMMTYLLLLHEFVRKVDSEGFKKQIFLAYVYGFVVTSFVRYINPSFLNINSMMTMKQERISGVYLTRFSGFYTDPNYYVVNIIIALTLIALLYSKKKLNGIHALVLSTVLIFFVAQTGSKSGLAMLLIPVLILVYIFILQGRYLMFVLGLGAAVLGAVAIFSGRIQVFSNVLERLANSSASGLTSGRTELWSEYITYIFNHFECLLFGKSMANYTLQGVAAHNTYIDLIFELGIVGTVFLLVIVFKIGKINSFLFRRNIINYSIVAIIIAMYFFLSELQYFDPVFHLSLAIFILNSDFSNLRSIWKNRVELEEDSV